MNEFLEIPTHSSCWSKRCWQDESISIKNHFPQFKSWFNNLHYYLLCDGLQVVSKDVHHHVEGVEGEPGGEEDDTDCDQQQICSTSPCQFSCKPKQQQKIEEMKKNAS